MRVLQVPEPKPSLPGATECLRPRISCPDSLHMCFWSLRGPFPSAPILTVNCTAIMESSSQEMAKEWLFGLRWRSGCNSPGAGWRPQARIQDAIEDRERRERGELARGPHVGDQTLKSTRILHAHLILQVMKKVQWGRGEEKMDFMLKGWADGGLGFSLYSGSFFTSVRSGSLTTLSS